VERPSLGLDLTTRTAIVINEIDNLLRAEIFIDLFAANRASGCSFSTKQLEPLYSFSRSVSLDDVGLSCSGLMRASKWRTLLGFLLRTRKCGYSKDELSPNPLRV
jgi:hypothetical protein